MNISKTFFLVTLLLSVQSFSDEVGFFTFTPKGGAELLHPNGDPTTIIKIYFDSEIVYVTDEGEYLDLTKENLLKMIEIKQHDKNKDLVTVSGPIDASKVSFSNVGGKTTITINPTEIEVDYSTYDKFKLIRYYEITVTNFVTRDNILNTNETDDHRVLVRNKVEYLGFFAINPPNSCEIGDLGWQNFFPVDLLCCMDKADPSTTYNIDIAFIISNNNLYYRDLDDWKYILSEEVLPKVNMIYQNSGANVQFNVKAVKAFSEYKYYLNCPVGLDGLSSDRGLKVLEELVPRIQNDTGADLIYALHDYSDGARIRGRAKMAGRYVSPHFASRWRSFGSLTTGGWHGNSNLVPWVEKRRRLNSKLPAIILAHELGHNLGLNHDQAYYDYAKSYRTVMSTFADVERNKSTGVYRIPFFSSNEVRWKSNMCKDAIPESLFSVQSCYNISERNDTLIRLGDSEHNSQEALQYTIKKVSNYNELYRVNEQ